MVSIEITTGSVWHRTVCPLLHTSRYCQRLLRTLASTTCCNISPYASCTQGPSLEPLLQERSSTRESLFAVTQKARRDLPVSLLNLAIVTRRSKAVCKIDTQFKEKRYPLQPILAPTLPLSLIQRPECSAKPASNLTSAKDRLSQRTSPESTLLS